MMELCMCELVEKVIQGRLKWSRRSIGGVYEKRIVFVQL